MTLSTAISIGPSVCSAPMGLEGLICAADWRVSPQFP